MARRWLVCISIIAAIHPSRRALRQPRRTLLENHLENDFAAVEVRHPTHPKAHAPLESRHDYLGLVSEDLADRKGRAGLAGHRDGGEHHGARRQGVHRAAV